MGNKSRYIAGTSLGVMSVGFLATLPFDSSNGMTLLQNGFEAGLVGGLADWFAVTALFRHPLGIPIPHTALLPKNREKVTLALISVIEKELLNKESIIGKIKQIQISESLLLFAENQLSQPHVQKGILSFAEQLIQSFDPSKITPFVEQEIQAFLRNIDLSPLIGNVMDQMLSKAYDEKAFDYLLEKVEFWAAQPETRDGIGRMALAALGRLEVSGLMQFALNAFIGFMNEEKLGTMIQKLVMSTLYDLRQSDDERRIKIMETIREELQKLKSNKTLLKELEVWKQQWVNQYDFAGSLNKLFAGLQDKLVEGIRKEGFAEIYMQPFIAGLLAKLKSDHERIEQFEHWIHLQVAQLLEKHHLQIGKLVRDNLEKLDNATLTEMLEDKIGQDLQWIRVNGAFCGFLIGIVLGAIKLWI
ncbi:DUF445 domain-containing protein [Paenibacillus psychroresistens]|uniref:DUF445 domain-containing protein n=1 Tax=Paenibacillus psychroresistens TaxID=1778678 RepID=A0A6B8RMH2_9BACL|nr:DUF445 domain-containing protein [Paenibacillus psychroresistens]QGQ97490.1 DUF445 domain-containing protein [Paenibacillus psychroresistens]